MSVFFWLLSIPILVRLFLAARFADKIGEPLSEDQLDRDAHRAVILALSGFAFTGVE